MDSVKHIFFDLDHTLWDFEANSRETLFEIFIDYQLDKYGVTSQEDFADTYREVNSHFWAEYREGRLGRSELRKKRFVTTFERFEVFDEGLAFEIGEWYLERCPQKSALLPHARETLEYLSEKYDIHILSNGFDTSQRMKMKSSGIIEFFKHVITSDLAGISKPHIQIFEYARGMAGASREESAMIGDNLDIDIRGAAVAGFKQVYYNPEKIEHDFNPTAEVQSLDQLREIL